MDIKLTNAHPICLWMFLFLWMTALLKAFIVAGDSSSQSSSKTIGCFFASSIFLSCSAEGFSEKLPVRKMIKPDW